MRLIERLHEKYVKSRRVRALAASIAPLVPINATVLDVGSGDGLLADAVQRRRPDVRFRGIDVMARADARIPVTTFDGTRLPFPGNSFDVVLFADVLHHTAHAEALLRDARDVARQAVIIKDHCADGVLAWPTLRFMDRVGNARFGVALPHLYLRWDEWQAMFGRLGMAVTMMQRRLGLYPPPLTWVFDRSLHFVAVVVRRGAAAPSSS
ncbi:MAG TPA: class I SAM-dependent methyltransferase [Gemmatimonadaceae bacterium]|nr:class I SAM-dependent methyltransferase [Gemmatimonadaceae bacterium]